MKKGWETFALGDLCEIIGGGTPSKNNPDYYSGNIPWATVRDMRNEVISETEFKITEKAIQSSSTNVIPSGNVVIATRVGLGKVCLLSQDTAINQDLRGIIPKDDERLMTRFLFWWLRSIAHLIEAEGTGATVKGVKLPFVKSLQIPIPPLAEQKRIVALLDEAFAGLATAQANAEKNLQNAHALFESQLQTVFSKRGEGWVEKRLETVCSDIFAGGDVPKQNHSKVESEKYRIPIYTNGEKNNGLYGFTDTSRVTTPSVTISARGTIGYAVLRNESYYPAIRLIVVIPRPDVLEVKFMYYSIKNAKFDHSGTSIPQLTVPMVRDFPIYFPSLSKQREIVAHLDALSAETQRVAKIYEQKQAALAALKKSLLHQAFSGEP